MHYNDFWNTAGKKKKKKGLNFTLDLEVRTCRLLDTPSRDSISTAKSAFYL